MMEDPDIIRLNIRHYQELLKFYGSEATHRQVRKFLAEAEARLPAALAETSEQER